ncbi:hypothetical protein DEO72_LG5g1462 [Vigna unguiculata]|uniref:Uncharacterized protein n=1 Tax=Vigna unguiculata TaxID=3917 RepID=A0A4D6LXH4_VIGUN|nr:hypothetical protein DEO72_LG5g1462 [Vigna unguiculata]
MLALVVDISTHPRVAHPRAKCYKCYNVSIPHTQARTRGSSRCVACLLYTSCSPKRERVGAQGVSPVSYTHLARLSENAWELKRERVGAQGVSPVSYTHLARLSENAWELKRERVGAQGVSPVSYTHLARLSENAWELKRERVGAQGVSPVSYTHLARLSENAWELKPGAFAQARSPRSGERSPLAQAASPRLGEITTEALGGFSHARLGEPSSPERPHSSPKERGQKGALAAKRKEHNNSRNELES